ncbi:XRE family transcriptional regulator (plasmid) [Azospirillum brasilense]|nr:helix-turn-helix transcriptional regulator [Azospirillum brasilense]YP_001686845.1 helix-turn-helix transcriptional regulator [Azospirillum phage Cd]PWC93077.1 hypothetical protein AEJ54_14130 [Azospirillum sp. Sp 7]OPH16830.1 hypothetical protein FE89_02395 [Azospirillum brasilense]OPH21621.1 hypothetical protein FE88_08065 [Azospirillum brasilense]QCO12882.1 XRE family transcriptional regulator [Azospirillum brasilense]QEM00004.1 XRE family transcriptional regulator [Azospirillum brasile
MNVNVESVSPDVQRVSRYKGAAMHVTEQLRVLRNRAGLSMEKAAKAIGLKGGSSYQRYEDPNLFRDEHLPLDIAKKLADAFAEHGVPKHETLALAGIPTTPDAPASGAQLDRIPVEHVRATVRALAEMIAEAKLPMTAIDQGDLVATFCRWYQEEVAAGRQPGELSVDNAKPLLRLMFNAATR